MELLKLISQLISTVGSMVLCLWGTIVFAKAVIQYDEKRTMYGAVLLILSYVMVPK